MNILVTGGCGYIGSHLVKRLVEDGHSVGVYDTGARSFEIPERFFGAWATPRGIFETFPPEVVFHLAGRISVAESVQEPRLYVQDNLIDGVRLIDECVEHGVRAFVFASSAAVYGNAEKRRYAEDDPCLPMSAYGDSKLALERILARYSHAYGLRSVSLRFFNASGGTLPERHEPETHLIPLAIDAALGRRGPVQIFGTDYPTTDGTAVRDYVNVTDLVDGHVAAMQYLLDGGATDVFNLGSGEGSSVYRVLIEVGLAAGASVPIEMRPRREGDPAALVANIEKAKRILGWEPKRSLLPTIVKDAWSAGR
jgi:UDP-glucose 4-epimerase